MEKPSSRGARRIGVIVNYMSALIAATAFCIGEYRQWTLSLGAVSLLALLALAISFYFTHVSTGLWVLTHTKIGNLDEREIQVTHTSLRYAYGIFGLLALVAITLLFLSMRFSFLTLTPGGYPSLALTAYVATIYLKETLPASVIAWTEPGIYGISAPRPQPPFEPQGRGRKIAVKSTAAPSWLDFGALVAS